MALTEYSIISAPLFTWASMALKEASTGPLPSDWLRTSWPSTVKTICACGCSPVSLRCDRETKPYFSFSGVTLSSLIRAMMSSSKISLLRSAKSLNSAKAALSSASLSGKRPSSSRRSLKALRPESLPSTILLALQPTSSARMIS